MPRRSTGPDRLAVECVLDRDRFCCAYCSLSVGGTRGLDYDLHHRRPRRVGGDRRPDVNLPSNLVLLHRECHEFVERHRAAAYDLGLLLPYPDRPSRVRIRHAVHGLCWLTDDGGVSAEPPMEVA